MNELQVFDFKSHAVRIVHRDGNPWFIAADVAAILDYRDAHNMVRNLDDDEQATHIVSRLEGGREVARGLAVISESGLFAAILKSRKPEARAFRRWVTGEVLPALRRTGRYAMGEPPAPPPATSLTDPAWLNAAVATVRESRRLFGPGIARAVWRDLGLPMPVEAQEMLPDGLAQAVAVWVQGRDRFTTADVAEALGLGQLDHPTARRINDLLAHLGFERRRFRRRKVLVYGWMRRATAQGEAA